MKMKERKGEKNKEFMEILKKTDRGKYGEDWVDMRFKSGDKSDA
jgi:hypothetical protein